MDVPGAGSRPLYPSGVLLPEGELVWGWWLDPRSCALTDDQGSLYTGGGRVVGYLGDRPFRLKAVVPGGE